MTKARKQITIKKIAKLSNLSPKRTKSALKKHYAIKTGRENRNWI